MKKEFWQLTRKMTLVFIILNGLLVAFHNKLAAKNINLDVVIMGNFLLYAVGMINLWFQIKALRNPNLSSGAVIRGLMAGTFIKLFVLAGAAIIYLFAAGEGRSVNAVFVSMGLYIVYTWMEVRISLQMNPKK